MVKSMAWSNFKFQLGCVKYFVYFFNWWKLNALRMDL